MPWAAAAAVAGSLISADSQRSASNKATDAQSRAAADANALQKYMYDQTRQDAQPYRDIGYGALDQLSVLLGLSGGQGSVKPRQRTEDELRAALAPRYAGDAEGLNAAVQSWQQREQAKVDAWRQGNGQDTGGLKDPNFGLLTKKFEDQGPFTGKDLQNDAGYQFRLQQGQDALENSRAAMGGLFSGATGKALSEYGQGFASNEFQNAYNRYTNDQNIAYNRYNNDQSNLFNRLSGLAGTGQTANQQVQGAGMNYANQVGGNLLGMGNAQAANQLAQGSIRGNMLNQGFAALGRGIGGDFGGQYTSPNIFGSYSNPAGDTYDFTGGNLYGSAGDYSDIALKTDIELLGTREDGLGVYVFRYLWEATKRIGFMAQEVEKVYPEAVSRDPVGFLKVDYSKVP